MMCSFVFIAQGLSNCHRVLVGEQGSPSILPPCMQSNQMLNKIVWSYLILTPVSEYRRADRINDPVGLPDSSLVELLLLESTECKG